MNTQVWETADGTGKNSRCRRCRKLKKNEHQHFWSDHTRSFFLCLRKRSSWISFFENSENHNKIRFARKLVALLYFRVVFRRHVVLIYNCLLLLSIYWNQTITAWITISVIAIIINMIGNNILLFRLRCEIFLYHQWLSVNCSITSKYQIIDSTMDTASNKNWFYLLHNTMKILYELGTQERRTRIWAYVYNVQISL